MWSDCISIRQIRRWCCVSLQDYASLAKLRYDEGYVSYLDVLDAQRSLFDTELQYVSVRGDVFTSLVNTYKAMGGGRQRDG